MELLTWLENIPAVTWIRESDSLFGYTLYLAGHTIGLVFLLGPNLVIAARVLGLAPDLPLRPVQALRPVLNVGVVLTVVTGSVLFATAPVGYVHNVVFIVKIASIVLAFVALRILLRDLFADGRDPDLAASLPGVRAATVATLVCWTIAVVAGRLTAYSGVVVIASVGAFLSLVAAVAAVGLIARVVLPRRERPRAAAFPINPRQPAATGVK